MRYLKKFEELDEWGSLRASEEDIKYHMQVIKDVFQDIFDEYDIEELLDDSNFGPTGLFYSIFKAGRFNTRLRYNCIYLKIRELDHGSYIRSEAINTMDLSGHIKRLQNMGYSVSRYDGSFTRYSKHSTKQKPAKGGGTSNILIEIGISNLI